MHKVIWLVGGHLLIWVNTAKMLLFLGNAPRCGKVPHLDTLFPDLLQDDGVYIQYA